MFADHWVIALLVTQLLSLVMIILALPHGIKALRHWDSYSGSELQLDLERHNYLISTLVRYVLIVQSASLLLFLFTVNNHLPGLIKGAMCASGTLTVNGFGYPVLYLKLTALLLNTSFLIINKWDQAEPGYPLTPLKYVLLFPVAIVLAADMFTLVQYFYRIQPDVIATCCSVSFSVSGSVQNTGTNGAFISYALAVFYLTGIGLITLLLIRKFIGLIGLLSIVFTVSAVYSLKYHFARFIYALPSHTCLFDMFWGSYYYMGFILFSFISIFWIAVLRIILWHLFRKRLQGDTKSTLLNNWRLAPLMIFAYLATVSGYWMYWRLFRI